MRKKIFISSFFSKMNENEVDYFVYGSYLSLPDDTGGSDIDLIVSEKDFHKVENIFDELTNKTGVSLESYYANANAKFYRFLSCQESFGVQIDVFYKGLCYQGIEYYPIQLLRDRIIDYRGIKVLDIKKGYYVDCLKEILHLGKAKEKYIKAFIEEVISDHNYYSKELSKLYGKKAAELFLNNLSVDKLPFVTKKLQRLMIKSITKGHHLKRFWLRLLLLKRLFGKRPGYVIVVEGTDGSGKSTIINAITPILNEGFHNGIVYNHLRPNVIPDMGVLIGKRERTKSVEVVSNPHAEKQSGLFGSFVRWGYYMIDYTFGYLKAVYPVIHTKSKIFIFDRYYYDYYIDQKRSKTNLPNWVLKFGERFLPKPDIILCLGGDPEKIYKRKPETSLEEVTRQTNALKHFCNNHKNAVWIDTCTNIETSTKDAMTAICNMMAKRFSKL